MKKFPSYKDSGVEWIGEIPEHWQVKRLKHLANVQMSGVDKKTIVGEKQVFLCNYVDVYKNDFITAKLNFMQASATDSEITRFLLQKGDVIVTKDSEDPNDIGVPALVVEDFDNVICGYHLAQIRANDEDIVGSYLFYLFSTSMLRQYFSTEASGVTRFGLGSEVLSSLSVPIPPRNEQVQITDFLKNSCTLIDVSIKKKQKLINLLNEEKAAIINHAVTKGLDDSVPMKPSGIEWLGDIPAHWELKRLKYLLNVKNGDGIKSDEITSDGTIPIYGGNGIMGLTSKYNSNSNDLIIGRVGAKCGNVRLVDGEKWVSDNALLAYTSENKQYIKNLLESMNLNRLANQNAQPLITGTLIRDQVVAVPSVTEQKVIVEHLERKTTEVESLIVRIRKEIDLLTEYKTSLIYEVVTGKIKVDTLVEEPMESIEG